MPGSELERLQQRIAELIAENAELRDAVREQAELNEELRAKVRSLEWEQSQHSGNSGKPPSSDTVTQRQEQNQARESRAERRRKMRARLKEMEARDKQKRRPGKQPGDEGHRLSPVDHPDATLTHPPTCCRSCGADLADAEVLDVERRQVFDVPEPRVEVTEHRAERRQCALWGGDRRNLPARGPTGGLLWATAASVGDLPARPPAPAGGPRRGAGGVRVGPAGLDGMAGDPARRGGRWARGVHGRAAPPARRGRGRARR